LELEIFVWGFCGLVSLYVVGANLYWDKYGQYRVEGSPKILHRQKEITQVNSNTLMHIYSNMTKVEQANITNAINIMSLFLRQKQRIDELEVKCQ
jgi:hypothetical protein